MYCNLPRAPRTAVRPPAFHPRHPPQSFPDSECLNTAVKITGLFGGTVGDEEAGLWVGGWAAVGAEGRD